VIDALGSAATTLRSLIEFSAQAETHAYGACPPEASDTLRNQSHV